MPNKVIRGGGGQPAPAPQPSGSPAEATATAALVEVCPKCHGKKRVIYVEPVRKLPSVMNCECVSKV